MAWIRYENGHGSGMENPVFRPSRFHCDRRAPSCGRHGHTLEAGARKRRCHQGTGGQRIAASLVRQSVLSAAGLVSLWEFQPA